jgi:hypothetical protein
LSVAQVLGDYCLNNLVQAPRLPGKFMAAKYGPRSFGYLAELALLVLLATLWGASYTFIKLGVESIPPVTFIAARTTIAAVVLVGVLYGRGVASMIAVTSRMSLYPGNPPLEPIDPINGCWTVAQFLDVAISAAPSKIRMVFSIPGQ